MKTTIKASGQAKQINTNNIQLNHYKLRLETLDGKRHLVVPVVMMVEGVHSGSDGPILHLAEELGRFPGCWDGIPVVINHPEMDGVSVSANSPDQLEKAVGRVFNTYIEDGKLKAEAWLDERKLMAASPQALQYIREQRPLDVSIGIFAERELVEEGSEYEGESYTAIARNHRPDHLALLPGGQGACGWADGCGVRVNQSETNNKEEKFMADEKKVAEENPTVADEKISTNENGDNLLNQMLDLNRTHFYRVELITNETGYAEVMDKLRRKVDSMDNDQRVYFLVEVFEDNFIYRAAPKEGIGGQPERMYKQEYSIGDDQQIEFVGEPVEVRREVEYVTMSMRRTKGKKAEPSINTQTKEGGKTMSEKEKSPCLIAKVDGLIDNERTHFVQEDKEWLLGFSEDQLNKLEPIEPKQEDPVKEKEPEELQINREQALEALKLDAMEDYIKLMPEDMQKQVEAGLGMYRQNRITTIEAILNGTDGVWSEDELNELPCEKLEKINKSIKQPVDYSGAGAGSETQTNQKADDDEKLMPAGMGEIKKDEK